MNLWGRAAGYAFLAFIVLISCREDETSLLGFKKSNNKFKVTYQEVGVASSVMAIDSVRTYNNINLPLTRRLLVGNYMDNKFGEITAEAYTQFQPLVASVSISEQAKFVSVFLTLSFDFYQYGDDQITTSNFAVHELLDSIPPVFDPIGTLPRNVELIPNYQPYYFNSAIPYDPTPLGSAVFSVNPSVFDQRASDVINNPEKLDHKTIDSLAIPLSSVFGSKLFLLAKGQTNDYKIFSKFRRIFKGLVVRPGSSDSRVVGFNPAIDSTKFTKSRVIIFYDEPDANGVNIRKKLEYTLFNPSSSQLFGFSRVAANRTGTQLAALPKTNEDVELDGNRYYQSGNPVTTKLNFDQFFAFADTIPNLIFNQVALSIEPEDVEIFRPPASLRLRYVNSANEFININSNVPEESGFPIYPSMTSDEEGYLIIGKRFDQININPVSDLRYNATTKSYNADLTDFFQSLYNIKDPDFRYTTFALVAASPPIGLSVDRVFFNKEDIKLKIIYTIPVVNK